VTKKAFSVVVYLGLLLIAHSKTASAQIWGQSKFSSVPGTQELKATCSTSPYDPMMDSPVVSAAAKDYRQFFAECVVQGYNAQGEMEDFQSNQQNCPAGPDGTPPDPADIPNGSPAISPIYDPSSPSILIIATCTVIFTPQPGLTYRISSTHGLFFTGATLV